MTTKDPTRELPALPALPESTVTLSHQVRLQRSLERLKRRPLPALPALPEAIYEFLPQSLSGVPAVPTVPTSQKYKCTKCPMTFIASYLLENHEHKKVPCDFKCKTINCSFTGRDRFDYYRHQKRHIELTKKKRTNNKKN